MLDEGHRLVSFRSGQPELDAWPREHALGAGARRTARTFIWHRGDGVVVAYYSLAAHLLQREELPPPVGRGAPRQIPGVLLARLALDESLHHQAIGGALLAEALGRVVAVNEIVAARFVVVDAIEERAAGFYAHHGFRPIPGTLRLVQKVSDIAAALS